ncbi:SDR family oxidoreductase [Pseudonocardia sp. MH-G8]|uniref:SDR family NAD(P)-dependent oxidoreductase n=1 Tax=Pseudonocardia sp. MH-G8 TaxID=1854588 RepID=UPI001E33B984|nr:SDR family oxidoreductase [Pseudonocardia sp. MH-G8]
MTRIAARRIYETARAVAPKPLPMFSLRGRRALVTGAGSGIGSAIAAGLAAAGADVVLGSDSANLAAIAGRVREHGVQAVELVTDLADRAATDRAISELLANRAVDILVNNAGVMRRAPSERFPDGDWDAVLEVNATAAFRLAKAVGGPMLDRGEGKIINIASMLSFQGGWHVPAYAASKHAILGLTRSLANEWAGRGVQVNAIAPGYISTATTAALRADTDRERAVRGRIPAGRWGTPDDLVGAAVFLASAASDYVSGAVVAVDGGWLTR